jgi:hypothetical protein
MPRSKGIQRSPAWSPASDRSNRHMGRPSRFRQKPIKHSFLERTKLWESSRTPIKMKPIFGNIKTPHRKILHHFRKEASQRQETIKTSKLENAIEHAYEFRFWWTWSYWKASNKLSRTLHIETPRSNENIWMQSRQRIEAPNTMRSSYPTKIPSW